MDIKYINLGINYSYSYNAVINARVYILQYYRRSREKNVQYLCKIGPFFFEKNF